MRTPARMLAVATLAVLTVLPAGIAQAGVAGERGQRVLERTLAREHHAVPALERSLQLRNRAGDEVLAERGLAAQRKALYQSELERTLARHRALGAIAAQPATRTDPAAPSPGVDMPATLLVGLVGGLLGGAAAMLGWTATTRRRRPRAAAGTSSH
jgi:hypothetical protein